MTLEEMKIIFPESEKQDNIFGYIYVTFNVDEGLFYIGKISYNKWRNDYYGSGRFPKEWIANGITLLHWPIQWCFSKEELNQAEFNWIDKFKDHNDIRNMHMGGQCNNDFINERAKKIRSEEFIGKNNPMYGKEKSLETRQKISNTKKERYKNHMYKNYKRNCSEETRKKISERIKKNWAEKKGIPHICKPVRCIETGIVYDSISEAGRAFGKKNTCINEVCNGKRKTTLGYHWEWVKNKDVEALDPTEFSLKAAMSLKNDEDSEKSFSQEQHNEDYNKNQEET